MAFRILSAGILLLMFGLATHSVVNKAPTFDEQGFITRGLGYLRGENRIMRVGHPLGLNALNAVFLTGDESISLPLDDPSWQETSFHRPSELFLWEIGNDVEKVMFLARVPSLFLGLLLATIVARWTGEMTTNRWASLLALSLVALDPNILAHMSLATTDLGLAAGAVLAGSTLWRYLRAPSWSGAILAGVAIGLLQNTKFTAGLFVPLFALIIIVAFFASWREMRDGGARKISSFVLPLVIAYPLAAILTLWALYGFDVGTLPDTLPTFSQLGGLKLPLAYHLEQLLDLGGRMEKSTPAFLLGQYSDQGWWTYFPVAFILKTPLTTLLLLFWSLIWAAWHVRKLFREPGMALMRRKSVIDLAALLIPAFGYFGIALTTNINIGYRHLLPMLPFLAVFVGASLFPEEKITRPWLSRFPWIRSVAIGFLVFWLGISTLLLAPHFLTFFNPPAGGADDGWKSLVDSNLDWGQDLNGLAEWMDQYGVNHVWLSYFGEARPEYYGINYTGLPSNPPRLMNPSANPFYPEDPAPGLYAISATMLQGVHLENHDLFAWFKNLEPVATIGHSIRIYEVATRGEKVDLALGDLQLEEIPTKLFSLLGTNDVRPGWFNPSEAILLSGGENSWLALGSRAMIHSLLEPILTQNYDWVAEEGGVVLYRERPGVVNNGIGLLSREKGVVQTRFEQGNGVVQLDGYLIESASGEEGEIVLLTSMTQLSDPQPVKIFVHLTGPEDQILNQWDGLGAAWEGWRNGDTLVQVHKLEVPVDAPAGEYQMWVGLYDPTSLARWQTPAGDRILLQSITIP